MAAYTKQRVKCKICRRKQEDDRLLLCDKCNHAFHLYCLRPALLEVPKSDWCCPACTPLAARQCTRNKNYKQLAGETDNDSDADVRPRRGCRAGLGPRAEVPEEPLPRETACAVCAGEEDVHPCTACPSVFHLACHEPPLRHPPRSSWVCMQCKTGVRIKKHRRSRHADNKAGKNRKKAKSRRGYVYVDGEGNEIVEEGSEDEDEDEEDEDEEEEEAPPPQRRSSGRVSKRVQYNDVTASETESTGSDLHRTRRGGRYEEDMDFNNTESETEVERPRRGRPPRKGKLQPKFESRSDSESDGSEEDEEPQPPKSRNHPQGANMVFSRVYKHKSSWPFLYPVDEDEVPDYYEVVKKPMDLDTISLRLEKEEYEYVQDFVDDFELLFNNAVLYNKEDTEVYRCIEPLEKVFIAGLNKYLPDCHYQRDFPKFKALYSDSPVR